VRNALIAPVIGYAMIIVPALTLNRIGIPIGRFAAELVIANVLLAAVLVVRWRPIVPWRQLWPFGLVLALGFVAYGRPLFDFGFDWLSYGNLDTTFYVLNTERMLRHGFFDLPVMPAFALNQDPTAMFYSLYTTYNGARQGLDLLLAVVLACTGLDGFQAYMPVTICYVLLALCGIGALLAWRSSRIVLPLLASGVSAVSASITLAAMHQLAPQLGGLATGSTTLALIATPWALRLPGWPLLRYGLLCALALGAEAITYPETTPFVLPGLIAWFALVIWRDRSLLAAAARFAGVTFAGLAVLLNAYLFTPVFVVLFVGSVVTTKPNVHTSAFPYYLIPSGMANFWGFSAIGGRSHEPFASAAIVVGALLFFYVLWASLRLAWREAMPAALVACVSYAAFAVLFVRRSDFGLFKVVMYMQPYVIAVLCVATYRIVGERLSALRALSPASKKLLACTPVILVAVAGLNAQVFYVEQSRGIANTRLATLAEIPRASADHVLSQLRDLAREPRDGPIVADTSLNQLGRLINFYFRPSAGVFPAHDIYNGLFFPSPPHLVSFQPEMLRRISARSQELYGERDRYTKVRVFVPPSERFLDDPFYADTRLADPRLRGKPAYLIATTARLSIVNRSTIHADDRDFVKIPYDRARDHLIFLNSHERFDKKADDPRDAAIGALEPDPFGDGMFASLGRYILFEVVNPTRHPRLVLELTTTLNHDGRNELPSVHVIGKTAVPMGFVGNGSGSLVSPPVEPQAIDGHWYIAVDLGSRYVEFPEHRSPIMGLFGQDVRLDSRKLVGFARNISLVSEAEYRNLSAPAQLDAFPGSLRRDVQYSGLYEDGWVGRRAVVFLNASAANPELRLKGAVPSLPPTLDGNHLDVTVDGQRVVRRYALGLGEFDAALPLRVSAGKHRVELAFDRTAALPGDDRRPVAAHIVSIGLVQAAGDAGTTSPDVFDSSSGLAVGDGGWYSIEHFGGETFRWLSDRAIVRYASPKPPAHVVLRVAPGPGAGPTGALVTIRAADGRVLVQRRLLGRASLDVPVPPRHGSAYAFRIDVAGGNAFTPGDPRHLNVRVFASRE
jgi:hypothetical protein